MGERYKLEVRPETGTVIDLIDTKTYDIVCDFLHTDTHDQSREAQHVLTALNFHEHDRPALEARVKRLEEALDYFAGKVNQDDFSELPGWLQDTLEWFAEGRAALEDKEES